VITDKYFWVGLALYIAAASAFGDTGSGNGAGSIQRVDWSGTLIFSNRTLLQGNESDSANYSQPGTSSSAGNGSAINQIITGVVELPVASAEFSHANEPTGSRLSDGGITSMQIARGTQTNFIEEDVTPAPEPATWLAATLATGMIALSQRRRFARWRETKPTMVGTARS
jgi:hypothetical protein